MMACITASVSLLCSSWLNFLNVVQDFQQDSALRVAAFNTLDFSLISSAHYLLYTVISNGWGEEVEMKTLLGVALVGLVLFWMAFNVSIVGEAAPVNHIQPGKPCFIFSQNAGFLNDAVYEGVWMENKLEEDANRTHYWSCEGKLASGPQVFGDQALTFVTRNETCVHFYSFDGSRASWHLTEP